MIMISGNNYSINGNYYYSAEGERTYKLNGGMYSMIINGSLTSYILLDHASLYVSPYLVASDRGCSKHIYAGTERIASHPLTGSVQGIDDHISIRSIDEIREKQEKLYIALNDMYNWNIRLGWNLLDHLRSASRNMPKDEIYYYHTDHLGSSSWITYTDGIPVQYLSYMPFGESQMDQRSGDWNSRYTFSGKERDEETGYSYFGARYYDPEVSIWLSRDPLADKYPYQSPYVYCGNNPLKIIDPNGEDEWEFDQVAGKFNKIGDKGGSETDHYNIGQRNEKGEFTSDQTVSIDRNGKSNINSFRIEETKESTISAFHIPDAKEGELSSGFFLEPKGPSTEKSGQNQRIPEGNYNIENHNGTDYQNVPKLFNDKVSKERAILIHNGNYPKNTRGCLLVGDSKGNNYVGNSVKTLGRMNNYINSKGHSNIKINIFNLIK